MLYQVAGELYGAGGQEQQAVKAAAEEVGLSVAATVPGSAPSECEREIIELLRDPVVLELAARPTVRRLLARARQAVQAIQ